MSYFDLSAHSLIQSHPMPQIQTRRIAIFGYLSKVPSSLNINIIKQPKVFHSYLRFANAASKAAWLGAKSSLRTKAQASVAP